MTGTDLEAVQRNNGAVSMLPNTGALLMLPQYIELVRQIADTPFVPEALRRKPHEILACMLKGYELGMGPLQSLDSIDMIQGRPTLKPEAMRALVAQQGHTIRIPEMTNDRCVLKVRRKEWTAGEYETFTWTIEDARLAGLARKDSWTKYPRAMLLARVTSEVCRAHFADVIKGLSYTPEEVEEFEPVMVPPEVDRVTGEIAATVDDNPPPPVAVKRPPPRRARAEPVEVDAEQDEETAEVTPLFGEPFADKITDAQRRKLFALLRGLGITDEERMPWAAEHLGRPVESFNELSIAESSTLIEAAIRQGSKK